MTVLSFTAKHTESGVLTITQQNPAVAKILEGFPTPSMNIDIYFLNQWHCFTNSINPYC